MSPPQNRPSQRIAHVSFTPFSFRSVDHNPQPTPLPPAPPLTYRHVRGAQVLDRALEELVHKELAQVLHAGRGRGGGRRLLHLMMMLVEEAAAVKGGRGGRGGGRGRLDVS